MPTDKSELPLSCPKSVVMLGSRSGYGQIGTGLYVYVCVGPIAVILGSRSSG